MMIKTYLAATIVAVLAFAPANADAATLSGSSSGTFTSEDAGRTCTAAFFVCIGGVDGATIDTSTIEWPGDTFGFNSSNPPRSSLTINDENFTYTPTLGAGVYKVGSLTWSNAASPANITPDEFSATAVIELAFNQPTNQTVSRACRSISPTPVIPMLMMRLRFNWVTSISASTRRFFLAMV